MFAGSFKGCHRQSRPLGKCGVIGEVAAAVGGCAAMGVENHVEPECLWRLRNSQPRTVRRRFDISGAVDQFDGVGDLYRGNGRAGERRGIDRTRNQRSRDEWPRRIVDQNDVRLLTGQRFQSGAHRGLPGRAAICRGRVAQRTDGRVEHHHIIGIQNRLYGKYLWMTAKRLHGPVNHRLSADRTVLLRASRTGTKPASGCDEDGCSPLCFRHWLNNW
jgi:hypothetical protein